jgi:hypothetical protein
MMAEDRFPNIHDVFAVMEIAFNRIRNFQALSRRADEDPCLVTVRGFTLYAACQTAFETRQRLFAGWDGGRCTRTLVLSLFLLYQ